MTRLFVAMVLALAGVGSADAQSLVCFGVEPSWSIAFEAPERVRVTFPDAAAREYSGRETRHEPLKERVWRGSAKGSSGDLVVFLREASCSDGMSDTTHPYIVRASSAESHFMVGCCRIPGGQAQTGSHEGNWRLQSLTGLTAATLAALPRGVTLRFESGRVSGFTGCNNVSGGYKRDGNSMTIGPLAGTMMACPEPGSTIERAFGKALDGTHQVAVAGDRMTLTSASGTEMVFTREAAPSLDGTRWNVTAFNNGRQAVVSPIANTALTLSFENGTVSGQAGCNTFRAPYSVKGDGITIGPAATTRKACSDDVMTQEREFLNALASAATWSITGGLLHKRRADDQVAITAVPVGK